MLHKVIHKINMACSFIETRCIQLFIFRAASVFNKLSLVQFKIGYKHNGVVVNLITG